MRVIHISQFDISGGAARAAYRIHHCLRGAGIDSRMWVEVARSGDWTVEQFSPMSRRARIHAALRQRAANLARRGLKTGNPIIHSPAVMPSNWPERINASDADVVHLHWVGAEMLGIQDLARINKPLVWTLHDMWAFCGAEHYTEDARWREGYRSDNRPTYEQGFDLNRWTWHRKRKHWQHRIHMVAPSRWLVDCVRESALMSDWPVDLISYPIDLGRWSPVEQAFARNLLGLPLDVPLLLFGATGGGRDQRKGFDLLTEALDRLRGRIAGLELVVFGQLAPRNGPDLGYPAHYTGHLHDDISLRALYSAADVFALPSRQDNLPLTCMEALSCGTPVVAFDNSGPPSMIEHKKTGYLAPAFRPADFAEGIQWILRNQHELRIRLKCRQYAEQHFEPTKVAEQYRAIYDSLLPS